MLLSAVLFVATLYSATAIYPGLGYYCYFVSCPILSCANPLPPTPKYGYCCPRCPIDCRTVLCPAPSCPNPIPPGPGECCSKCIEGQTCPIEGQVFQQCRSCPVTCANRNQITPCPLICRPGCGCPRGTVIDEINQRCVRPESCPNTPTCPIQGQVFQQCRTCPATCEVPDIACIAICQPGCGCPPRQLIDEQNNKCVARNQCPSNNGNKCKLPRDPGPCEAAIPRYFYNTNTRRCQRFIYGGCRGNDNNFRTIRDCLRQCSSTSSNPTATCRLPRDPGPCLAAITRFFYNSITRRCERFLYGGCRGNANNFESLRDCERRCNTDSTNPRYPLCSPNYCASRPDRICTVPVNTLGATVRRSHCDVTICRACYYSPRPLPLPRLNRQCPQIIPLTSGSDSCADSRELQQWASCVDNAYKRRYRNRQSRIGRFRCWRPPYPYIG